MTKPRPRPRRRAGGPALQVDPWRFGDGGYANLWCPVWEEWEPSRKHPPVENCADGLETDRQPGESASADQEREEGAAS